MIAGTDRSGPEEKHPRALSLVKAQAAAAERAEFKGNVAFVGTKAFWRGQEQSHSGQGDHWNSNAETQYLIGEAMGIVEFLLTGRLLRGSGGYAREASRSACLRNLFLGPNMKYGDSFLAHWQNICSARLSTSWFS